MGAEDEEDEDSVYVARFPTENLHSTSAIGFHAFALLEALPCV
jgi:hypothetical protein